MKNPSIHTVESIRNYNTATEIKGKWIPARPIGLYGLKNRIRCAWYVFTGKADALFWDGQ